MQIELTNEELTAIYNGLEYAHEGHDSDMSLMDDESQAELARLSDVKERIKGLSDAQQDRSGGE